VWLALVVLTAAAQAVPAAHEVRPQGTTLIAPEVR